MKTYICTEVITYNVKNQKSILVNDYVMRFKHKLFKGKKPAIALVKAIKDYCKILDKKFQRTRPLIVQSYALQGDVNHITIYCGDPTSMSGQPKAAVILLAPLAGEIDIDKLESGTLAFEPEEGGEAV